MAYYTVIDDSLITAENKKTLTTFYKNVKKLPEDYVEGKYIVENNELVLNPNYEQEQAAKEHERIQELSMTRSDFFDGTIKAFGLDSDDLLFIIAAVLDNIGISEIEKKVALNNFRNALNFYRKHTLFTILSGRPIPISSTTTILITADQWDKFFDETHKRNPEAYKELLPPAPTPVINEEPTEEVEEPTEEVREE